MRKPGGRWTTRWAAPLAVIGWLAVQPAGVVAQTQPADPAAQPTTDAQRDKIARDLFTAGRSAYDNGLFEDALSSFQRAHELSQRPQLLFNVGQAADRAGHEQVALDAFERYLREVPEAENRSYVEGRIVILKRSLEQKAAAASVTAPAAAPASAPAAATDGKKDEGSGGVVKKWWFWTAIGVGVVAIVATTAVLATRDPELEQGDVGGVISTLKVAP